MSLTLTATLIVLAGSYLADRTSAQQGGIGTPLLSTPLISTLNEQAARISRARQVRCLSPARFRWHPGHLVPVHMRRYVIGQRRTRLERDRARASMCGPEAAIRSVFGAYGSQAVAVAWCESRHNIFCPQRPVPRPVPDGRLRPRQVRPFVDGVGAVRSGVRLFSCCGLGTGLPWACKP